MTHEFLSKLFSLEVSISLGVMLVAFISGYSVLADDQVEQQEQIMKLGTRQEKLVEAVSRIQTDTAVLRTKQEGIEHNVERILRILESRDEK